MDRKMKSRIFLSQIFLSKNAEEIEIMVVVVVAAYANSNPLIVPVLVANLSASRPRRWSIET